MGNHSGKMVVLELDELRALCTACMQALDSQLEGLAAGESGCVTDGDLAVGAERQRCHAPRRRVDCHAA